MRRPIFLKIFAGFAVITLSTTILVVALAYEIIRSSSREAASRHLRDVGMTLREIVTPLVAADDREALEDRAKAYGSLLETRVTLTDAQGVVLADSEHDPSTMENHADRPEIARALKGEPGMSIRYSATLKKDLLYQSVPLLHGGRLIGVLRLSIALGHIDELLRGLAKRMALVSCAVLLLSLAMAALFSHLVTRPLRELAQASSRIASGDLSARAAPASNDEIRDLTEAFNDMAERLQSSFRELASRKEELETVVSSMNEALVVIDGKGRVVLHNERAAALSSAGDILGRYYWEAFRSPSFNEFLEKARGGAYAAEVVLQKRTYLCTAGNIPSRKETVVTLHDVTAVEEMRRFKKELVANAAHELKTPLTAIKGFTETCIDEAQGELLHHLEIILRHTNRLIAMVDDLLTLSSLEERPAVSHEDVRLKELIGAIVSVYGPKIREKGLDLVLDVDGEIVVQADPTLLEQLLINLLDNALKYTEHGRITLSARRTPKGLTIEVSDTGIGIAQEHLTRIFERFYVVDKSRSRASGGTGLGLSIAKHIAALHGGGIEVESTLGEGSTFRVVLPAR